MQVIFLLFPILGDILWRLRGQVPDGDDRDRGQRDDAEPGRGAPRLHRRPPLPPVRGGHQLVHIRVRLGMEVYLFLDI